MKIVLKTALAVLALTSALFADRDKTTDYTTLNTLGSKDAPIIIYNFTSLSCIHCKNFHEKEFEQIKANYIDKGLAQYKLILINNGEVSNASAIALTYLAKNSDEFYRNAGLLLKHQSAWNGKKQKIYELGLSLNITKQQINHMLNNDKFLAETVKLNSKARDANVRGTPTFVITRKDGNLKAPLAKIEGNPGSKKMRETIEKALIEAQR